MNKELALRTFAYLIGHYKTHDETTINKQEIEAIEFMLKNNENLEQQVEKQKEVIGKAIEYTNKYESIKAYYEYIDEDGYDEYNYDEDFKKELLDILKEVEK